MPYEQEIPDRNRPTITETSTTPIFSPSRPTKILVSPGAGAGWVTYAPRNSGDGFLIWMLTYERLIKGLERGEHKDRLEDIMHDFHKEAHMRFNVERLMVARVTDLVVEEVSNLFELRDTDGSERIVDISHRRTIRL